MPASQCDVGDCVVPIEDLYEIALGYFLVRPVEMAEMERLLIRARGDAVYPVLRALHSWVVRQQPSATRLAATPDGQTLARLVWARSVLKPGIDRAHDVVRRVGLDAHWALIRALVEKSDAIRIEAALLLAMEEPLSPAITGAIRVILKMFPTSARDSALALALGIAMVRAGDSVWVAVVDRAARRRNETPDDWLDQARNTALLALLNSA